MRPLVSVCIISYNHAPYFEQAIESVLVQERDFEIDIIICDDHSSDGTTDIIRRYASEYPHLIKAYYSVNNAGMHANWAKALKLCSGKYIALLESDDYWNDRLKLQKQTAILEKNQDVALCFTEAKIIYENKRDGYPWYVEGKKEKYTQEDLSMNNFIPTCTVMMRNFITDDYFSPAYYNSPFADWIIHFQTASHGLLHFLNEPTATYRVHKGGVWGRIDEKKQLLNRLIVNKCLQEISKDNKTLSAILNARKHWLQKTCHYFKTNGDYLNYLLYRIKLMLN